MVGTLFQNDSGPSEWDGLGREVAECHVGCVDWALHNSESATVSFIAALAFGKGWHHLMAGWRREMNYMKTSGKYLNFLAIGHELTDIKNNSIKPTSKNRWHIECRHAVEFNFTNCTTKLEMTRNLTARIWRKFNLSFPKFDNSL